MKTLLIVESPAKSQTIEKLLGSGYIVKSSFGHIRNLDKKGLGIDIKNNFKPSYKILTDRSKQIKAIQETIKKVDRVLLASDEDREGEAIAWHCAVVFKLDINETNRICFHEITKTALETAVANPRKINMSMVFSQQARRILDRLVGFQISPLLWKHIAPNLSAGRVQSVALKLLVEQEEETNKFTDKKTYKTTGLFDKNISATLNHNFDKKPDVSKFLEDCKIAMFKIDSCDKKRVEKKPPAPYITSTIQQDASSRFGLGAKSVMSALQKLYEAGNITYHRTDNTNLSTQIKEDIKTYVCGKFGDNYHQMRTYNSKIKCAQEAHEAIRPTNINKDNLDEESSMTLEKKIYNLIWKRTVASQMSACLSDVYTINIIISNRQEIFIASVEKIIFDGYKKIYSDKDSDKDSDKGSDKDSDKDSDNHDLSNNLSNIDINKIVPNQPISYIRITSSEKYQLPPPRYSESSIIKKMEKIGIGRPSTYSSIIETILERNYAEKKDVAGKKLDIDVFVLEKNIIKNKVDTQTLGAEKKKLIPTELGKITIKFLETNFQSILNYNFTSDLETKLDKIVNENMEWGAVVGDFYKDFSPLVEKLNIKVNTNDKKRFLGVDENNKNVYAYVGKYGPVVQIDEGKSAKYIKMGDDYTWDKIVLSEVALMNKFPKNIGKHGGKDILVKKGPYGIYLSDGTKNFKLSEGFDENLSLEDAIKCISGGQSGGQNSEQINNPAISDKSLPKTIDNYTIKSGKYGPYIDFEKKFYKIPKNVDLDKITKEICVEIINKKLNIKKDK